MICKIGNNLIGFAITVFLLFASCFLIYVQIDVAGQPTINPNLFIEKHLAYLKPEPVERLIFICAIVFALPVVLAANKITKNIYFINERLVVLFSAASVGVLCLVIWNSELILNVLTGSPNGKSGSHASSNIYSQFAIGSAVGAILIAATVLKTGAIRHKSLYKSVTLGMNLLLILMIVITVASLRMRSSDMVYGDIHFETVFYPLVQVAAGKTLIADTPSQYGLYAEIIAPIFAFLGLSTLTFSLVMVVFQGSAVFAFFFVCVSSIKLTWLRLLSVLSGCLFIGSTWIALWNDPSGFEYYQIWPIRFIFPALSLLLFVQMQRCALSEYRYYILALVAGVGVIWNIESGIASLGALLAYLLLKTLFCLRKDLDKNLRILATSLIISLITIAIFAGYLLNKGGGEADLSQWFKYQTIFYGSGFGMLPLPPFPHLWIGVCGIYLYGLVSGVFQHARYRPTKSGNTIFYLSILGLGLFGYYQGRSHDVVLSCIIWPALLVVFMLSDQVLRAVRAKLLPNIFAIIVSPIIVFGVVMAIALVSGAPRLLEILEKTFSNIADNGHPEKNSEVDFIKSKMLDKNSVVIIHWAQSILYNETGTASAVRGPGETQMLLVEDRERMIVQLINRPVKHLFIMREKGDIPKEYLRLLRLYKICDRHSVALDYLQPVSCS